MESLRVLASDGGGGMQGARCCRWRDADRCKRGTPKTTSGARGVGGDWNREEEEKEQRGATWDA